MTALMKNGFETALLLGLRELHLQFEEISLLQLYQLLPLLFSFHQHFQGCMLFLFSSTDCTRPIIGYS